MADAGGDRGGFGRGRGRGKNKLYGIIAFLCD